MFWKITELPILFLEIVQQKKPWHMSGKQRRIDMRLGKVSYKIEYMVDLDNEEMVDHGKDCVYEDVMSAVKFEGVYDGIKIEPAPDACEGDIPEFLLDNDDDE